MSTAVLSTGHYGPFTNLSDLMKDLLPRITADGNFVQVFPKPPTLYDGTGTLVLEPTNKVDSMRGTDNDRMTWRIAFTVKPNEILDVNIATPVQIKDDGKIATGQGWADEETTFADGTKAAVNPGEIAGFVSREHLAKTETFNLCAAYPMSYALTVTDHGIFFGVWDNAFDEYQNDFKNVSPAFRWLVIQRPVDNQTGVPLVTGRAPVFCAYTTMHNGLVHAGPEFDHASPPATIEEPDTPARESRPYFKYGRYRVLMRDVYAQFHYKFVVCEEDVYRPTLPTLADMPQPDSNPIINSFQMVSVSEENKYVITIPKGLNTPRYAYTHELDLIAYTSADVVGMLTNVELPVYEGNQTYRALIANRLKNTGMRILYRVA